jgi:hypothetical protein
VQATRLQERDTGVMTEEEPTYGEILRARAEEYITIMQNIVDTQSTNLDVLAERKDLSVAHIIYSCIARVDDDTLYHTCKQAMDEALRVGEYRLLTMYSYTDRVNHIVNSPREYVIFLCILAVAELYDNHSDEDALSCEECEMWGISVYIAEHYEPLFYSLFTREQIRQAFTGDNEQ